MCVAQVGGGSSYFLVSGSASAKGRRGSKRLCMVAERGLGSTEEPILREDASGTDARV